MTHDLIFDAQALLGREINPKVMTAGEWEQKLAQGHPFVLELLGQPLISRLAGMVTESVSFLYDSLEMLRWTALECQADVDVDAGRTYGFQSADDAISFLRAQRH